MSLDEGNHGFFGHVFLSGPVAESIGWPTGNRFQLEVGVANLAVGILGVVAAQGNTIQNISNLLRPALLIAFLAASRRAERAPGSQAHTPGFDRWREPRIGAAGLMTGTVAAGFGAGVAIDRPVIGPLVGALVGAGLTALVLARPSAGTSARRTDPAT